MKNYVIKDGFVINCIVGNINPPWQYPFPYDLVVPETEWDAAQYPYLAIEIPEQQPEPDIQINLTDFAPVFQQFLTEAGETSTYSEMMQRFNDYVAGLENAG